MTELPKSVERLVQPWVTVVKVQGSWVAQDFPPLLDMLQTLVVPSKNSRGGGGDASTRNVVDVKALDLLMHIQDVIGAWLRQWGIDRFNLTADTLAFHVRLESLWASGGISESEHTELTHYPETWATRIWDLVEPPLQVPLRGVSCPSCGRAKWLSDEDEMSDAILVSYREGGSVQAECRWRSCTFLAVGDRALLDLGYHAGATVDSDQLREMGVI